MMPDVFVEHPWLWTLVWQSTVCLGAGLGLSYWLRQRPVRAHRVLLWALIAAMVVPVLSWFVGQREWGWFVEETQAAESPERAPFSFTPPPALPGVSHLGGPSPVALSSVPAASREIRFEPIFVSVWVFVSLLLLIRLVVRFALGYCLITDSTVVMESALGDITEQAKTLLRLKVRVACHATPRISSPVVWCWSKKPVLLIPDMCEYEFAQLDWRGIVCHELAHDRRRDHITMFIAELVITCLPWHPLLWWTRQRLLNLSEQACDDWAIVGTQGSTGYARTLLELAPQGKALLVPAVVNSRGGLGRRVCRIIEDRCASPHSGLRWTLVVAALMTCAVMAIAFAQTRSAYTGVKPTIQRKPRKMRSIVFPEDRSLGVLSMRGPGFESWSRGWETVDEARGEVIIPAPLEAQLKVSQEAATDLSALADLGADDLQKLCFDGNVTQVGSLAPVGHLTGLKALVLPHSRFDSDDTQYLQRLLQLEGLRLSGDKLTDSCMKHVGKMTNLKSLSLDGPGLSDHGLKHLQGLTGLKSLSINGCPITDRGLRHLGNMAALETLYLGQTKISDAGLGPLQQLKRLTRISLIDNNITDAGLAPLQRLKRLALICIVDSNDVTDAGMVHIADLPDLAQVFVQGVGDAGIVHLSKLASLKTLQIVDAKLTEACITHLKSMESLQTLTISGDAVSDELFRMIRDALPDCKLWDPRKVRELDPVPDWLARFRAVYQLDEGQVLRRITPPFIPERRQFWDDKINFPPALIGSFTFFWDGTLRHRGIGPFRQSRPPYAYLQDLDYTLRHVLRLRSYEYQGPKELLDLKLPGDWIIRDETPDKVKLKALEQLLAEELGRKIHFEKQTVERQVAIATGRFELHRLPAKEFNQGGVHLYVDRPGRQRGAGSGGGPMSLTELLEEIADCANMPVINKAESSNLTNIAWRDASVDTLRRMESGPQKTEMLKEMLANVTQQTELQFELAVQPLAVWVIREER